MSSRAKVKRPRLTTFCLSCFLNDPGSTEKCCSHSALINTRSTSDFLIKKSIFERLSESFLAFSNLRAPICASRTCVGGGGGGGGGGTFSKKARVNYCNTDPEQWILLEQKEAEQNTTRKTRETWTDEMQPNGTFVQSGTKKPSDVKVASEDAGLASVPGALGQEVGRRCGRQERQDRGAFKRRNWCRRLAKMMLDSLAPSHMCANILQCNRLGPEKRAHKVLCRSAEKGVDTRWSIGGASQRLFQVVGGIRAAVNA